MDRGQGLSSEGTRFLFVEDSLPSCALYHSRKPSYMFQRLALASCLGQFLKKLYYLVTQSFTSNHKVLKYFCFTAAVILIYVRRLLLIIAQNISLLLIHSSWFLSSSGWFSSTNYLSLLVASWCYVLLLSILGSKLFSSPLLGITLITLEFL